MVNNNILQYIALVSVYKKIDIEKVLDLKFSFQKFAEELDSLRKNGCISDLDNELIITKLGLNRMKELEKNNDVTNKLKILPQYKYFIETIRISDIYLKE